jgi:ABC-type transport system involved in multi-copper enzyme maturation permease subunit
MIARTIRDELWKSLLCFLLLTVLITFAIGFYPGIKDKSDFLLGLVPKMFSGLVKDFFSGGYAGYVAGQQFFKGVNIVGSIFAVLFATTAIARESERRTLELLLSCPISRTRLFLTKFVVSALGLALPIFLSSILIIPMSALFIGEHLSLKPLFLCSLHATFVIWFVLAYSFLLSTVIDDQIKVAAAGLSIAVFMFLLLLFEQSERSSLYYYSHITVYRDIFLGKSYPVLYSGAMLAGTLLFLAAALRLFHRKDV